MRAQALPSQRRAIPSLGGREARRTVFAAAVAAFAAFVFASPGFSTLLLLARLLRLVEEHRQPPGGVQDVLAANGYVQQAYVRRLAEEAGFTFDKASEINANPKDTHDHPFGVWTLPPVRASSPRGKPSNPRFNHARYDAIGESDRMTLRFIKPA